MFLTIDTDNSAVQIDFHAPSQLGVRSKIYLDKFSVLSRFCVNRLVENSRKQFYHVA